MNPHTNITYMADPHYYGADDAAPFPGASWHYSRDAVSSRGLWPVGATNPGELTDAQLEALEAPAAKPMNTRINPDSPAGAAFVLYVNSGELGELGDSERLEFASVGRMWLETPIVAEDADVAPELRDWIQALEAPAQLEAPAEVHPNDAIAIRDLANLVNVRAQRAADGNDVTFMAAATANGARNLIHMMLPIMAREDRAKLADMLSILLDAASAD